MTLFTKTFWLDEAELLSLRPLAVEATAMTLLSQFWAAELITGWFAFD